MDQVKQIIDQLGRVLLAISAKSANFVAESSLQIKWRRSAVTTQPLLLEQDSEGFGELTFHAQWIVSVGLLQVVAHKEILDEFGCVGKTLQSCIHEAGVAEVLKAAKSANSATFWH